MQTRKYYKKKKTLNKPSFILFYLCGIKLSGECLWQRQQTLVILHKNLSPLGLVLMDQDRGVIEERSIAAVAGVVASSQAFLQLHHIQVSRLRFLLTVLHPNNILALIPFPSDVLRGGQAAEGQMAQSAVHLHNQN